MTLFMTIKVTMTSMLALTYSMTSKVMVSFMVRKTSFITPKSHGDLRARHDLLYDPNVMLTFWSV